MELNLNRRYKGDGYTIGTLTIDGKYFCDTLEDTDRGLDQSMTEANIMHIKVKGKTAIPTGTYRIDMATISPRFKARWWARQFGGIVPRLVGVRGFTGVLIHPGNTADDTDGCILVGRNADVYLHKLNPFSVFVCAETAAKLARCRERAAEAEA